MTDTAAEFFRSIADTLDRATSEPYGPTYKPDIAKQTGEACVTLCAGDSDKARTLWKLIAADLGYMPQAAAQALIRAANTENLVPDVTAPEPS